MTSLTERAVVGATSRGNASNQNRPPPRSGANAKVTHRIHEATAEESWPIGLRPFEAEMPGSKLIRIVSLVYDCSSS